jgi:hypothetical protein
MIACFLLHSSQGNGASSAKSFRWGFSKALFPAKLIANKLQSKELQNYILHGSWIDRHRPILRTEVSHPAAVKIRYLRRKRLEGKWINL